MATNSFLNQARWPQAPGRLMMPGFLELLLSANVCMHVCVCVCVCVCVPAPNFLITSGVMWCDIDPI